MAERRETRRRGREARRDLRTAHRHDMLPSLKRNLPLVEPMTPEQVQKIDKASMDILEEVGVVFRDPVALGDWERAGADVRGERVHLDRFMIRELIASIPADIVLHARTPKKSVDLGAPTPFSCR